MLSPLVEIEIAFRCSLEILKGSVFLSVIGDSGFFFFF